MSLFDFEIEDFEVEEESFYINEDGYETPNKYDFVLKCGKIKMEITEEEYNLFETCLSKYVKKNGVNFGFIREVLEKYDTDNN